jgi:pimeloyl-ACP methyl ester carboxylesterase
MIDRRVRGDGVELAAVEAGDPGRPAIVLVHGYPDSKEIWRGVIERLAPRFHVIAYDVRGFGGSSAPRGPAAYDLALLAGDLDAVIEQLVPGRPVHLVGHDWGGIAGWAFASMARLEPRLASFTSIAGPSLDQIRLSLRGLVRSGRILELIRRVHRSWYVLVLCAPGGPTLSWRVVLAGGRWSAYLENVEGMAPDPYYRRASLASDGTHGSNLYRRNILGRLGSPPDAAPARVPVQLIVPTRDRFISASYYADAERFAPLVVRRTVASRHWVPHSSPGMVAEWVAEFVEEVEAG